MDKGALFKEAFTIIPSDNGSFVLRPVDWGDPSTRRYQSLAIGFTNLDDLMRYLNDEAEAMFPPLPDYPQPLVVAADDGLAKYRAPIISKKGF